jgi:hypothetical protein
MVFSLLKTLELLSKTIVNTLTSWKNTSNLEEIFSTLDNNLMMQSLSSITKLGSVLKIRKLQEITPREFKLTLKKINLSLQLCLFMMLNGGSCGKLGKDLLKLQTISHKSSLKTSLNGNIK